MKRFLIHALMILVGGLACVVPVVAGTGAGAIVLQFPIGARYNAMGEAGSALAQDATAAWFNPGGLAFMASRGYQDDAASRQRNRDIQLMYSPLAVGLADDISLMWLGYAAPLGEGVMGLSLTYLDMGEQTATGEQGEYRGLFKSYAYAAQLNFAFKVSPDIGLGLGLKYFRDRLAPDSILQDGHGGSANSFGFDMGVLWKVPTINLNLAAVVQNLGPPIVHVDADQADPMPRRFTVGAAYGLYSSEYMGLLMVGDLQIPLYKWNRDEYVVGLATDQQEWGLGIEWSYDRSLFIRGGYKRADYGEIRDMTFGFGVDLGKWMNQAIKFDFASVPQAKGLERVNRFSLGYRW